MGFRGQTNQLVGVVAIWGSDQLVRDFDVQQGDLSRCYAGEKGNGARPRENWSLLGLSFSSLALSRGGV